MQLLPDTSSRWSKGPSAPVRGQLVLPGHPPHPPGWKPKRVLDPHVLPTSPSRCSSKPPSPAHRLRLRTAGPAHCPCHSVGPRGLGTRSGHRLLATPHPFPPSLAEMMHLKEARASRVQAHPYPDTSHPQSARPGLCSSSAC